MDKTKEIKSKFIDDLKNGTISDLEIVNRYMSFGTPHIFRDNESIYFDLKAELSNVFSVDPADIFMVGSSKLGFSIAPTKLWKDNNDESDIDMVIISDIAFDSYWKQLLEFNVNLTARSETEDKLYREFLEYFFKGWIRPDKFPFSFEKKTWWFDLFRSISYNKYDGRKVTGAIYRSRHFFNAYHIQNIKNIRFSIMEEK